MPTEPFYGTSFGKLDQSVSFRKQLTVAVEIGFNRFKFVFDREDILAVQGITLMMMRELIEFAILKCFVSVSFWILIFVTISFHFLTFLLNMNMILILKSPNLKRRHNNFYSKLVFGQNLLFPVEVALLYRTISNSCVLLQLKRSRYYLMVRKCEHVCKKCLQKNPGKTT